MYKECNLIIFLAVKLAAIWEQLSGDKAVQWQGHQAKGEGLCLQPITLAFVLLSQPSLFPAVFNWGQNKFSFSEGIPWGKTLRYYGHCVADTGSSENLSCKINRGHPSLDFSDKESTQPHCLGSAMHFQPSSGDSSGTESVSTGAQNPNVALQEERLLSFAEGTLAPLPVCACEPWHTAMVNSTKGCLCVRVCVLYLSRKGNRILLGQIYNVSEYMLVHTSRVQKANVYPCNCSLPHPVLRQDMQILWCRERNCFPQCWTCCPIRQYTLPLTSLKNNT